jgi:ATP-dependent RNA helicase RhlE
VTPVSSTADTVKQAVYLVDKNDKPALLEHLLSDKNIRRVLVFARTKHGADRVVKALAKANVMAEAIHGNKSQNHRQRALSNFKAGNTRVLVATDIAARGIDVEELTHVINYELPNEPETYVHRIGRTGRAGASGIALSFCEDEERAYLQDIQKLIRRQIDVVADHPYSTSAVAPVLLSGGQIQRPKGPAGRPSRPGREPRAPRAASDGAGRSSQPTPRTGGGPRPERATSARSAGSGEHADGNSQNRRRYRGNRSNSPR